MLATPIKDYRRTTRESNMSPSLRHSHSHFDPPLLTPSPHRRKSLQQHPQIGGYSSADSGLQSPFQTPAPPSSSWRLSNNDEPLVFSSGRELLLTPAKHKLPKPPQSPSLSATAQHAASRVGAGTKRKPTHHFTPLRQHTLTPLVVKASSQNSGISFDRLAPLPPPKFGIRTPKSGNETEASLHNQTASLTHLNLNKSARDDFINDDDDSGCDISEPLAGALFSEEKSVRRRTSNRLFKEVQTSAREVAEVSPGGHVTKRRARSRPVSEELLESVRSSPSPAARVAFPKGHHRRKSSGSSSSSNGPSPRQRTRVGLNGPNPARPSHLQNRAPLARVDSATMFFGGPSLQARSRTNSFADSTFSSNASRPRPNTANRHSYAGTGDGSYWSSFQPRSMLPSPKSSPPPVHDHDTTDDDDDIFNVPRDSSFVLTVDTPSPAGKSGAIASKFRHARDSGIALSDDDMSIESSTSADHLVPQASTSVTSIFSDGDDEGLVTPGVGPTASAGWPQARVYGSEEGGSGGVDMDAFILHTLTTGSKATAELKRAPNTPVKKVKTSYLTGARPWQSAVAQRVGRGIDWELKAAKAPRKSLPLAALPLAGRKQGKAPFEPSTDSEDEPEDSPSTRKEKYAGLGLGRPKPEERPPYMPKPRWLTRRSSSGAFSSGSESASLLGTPTRNLFQGGQGRIPSISPSKQSRFSPTRSASGSSTNSSFSSPTTTRIERSPAKRPYIARKSFGGRPSLSASQDQLGRFDRDFDVLEEIGSGEFGQVIKARTKSGSEDTYAIKKSKRYEGVKHRLRLLEEAEVLRHLSRVQPHPNVLAFTDSWEEDDVLYIQTEVCELGSLGHFLWEYGRTFPRLDEARVWKIIADLSNGLKFIHESGVIHLDVKPANIFVTSEGRFKIGDFGMASLWPRPVQKQPTVAPSAFEREGDKLYLAPEILQSRYGKAADVFSFGMTMLETATNIVVPDQGEAWHRLRREDFSQVDLDDSPELLELVRHMMRTDPEKRITIQAVWGHPAVSRARVKMEMAYEKAKREGSLLFAASPLASVTEGFLEEILGRGAMEMC